MTRKEKAHVDRKTGWLFRESWLGLFRALPDEAAGQLIKAVAAGLEGETFETDDVSTWAVANMMVTELLENREAYHKLCEQNKQNALKKGKQDPEAAEEMPFG